jgi:hypothetical protein
MMVAAIRLSAAFSHTARQIKMNRGSRPSASTSDHGTRGAAIASI